MAPVAELDRAVDGLEDRDALSGQAHGFVLLAGIIYGMATVPMVSARKIDKEYVWLNGVCKDYLDALPEWVKPS